MPQSSAEQPITSMDRICRRSRGRTLNTHLKRLIITLLLLCTITWLVSGASFSTISLDDPVYIVLEALELRGAVSQLPVARPYQQSTILRYLHEAVARTEQGNPGRISQLEKEIIAAEIMRITRTDGLLVDGSLAFPGEHLDAEMGLFVDTLSSVDLARLSDGVFANTNYVNFFLDGDIGLAISYGFDMAFAFNYAVPEAFTPYEFSADWDGYTYDPEQIGGGGDVDSFYSWAFRSRPEIQAAFFEDVVRVAFGRYRRKWGYGSDSLRLSGEARPIVAIEATAELTDWMEYSYLVGTLENSGNSTTASQYQNMVAMKQVTMRPWDWLLIGVQEAVVFPKRFELGYMNPLIFSSLYQGQIGDFDNIIGGATIGISFPGSVEAFATLFVDELKPHSIQDFFDYVRNFFSFQAGVRTPLPIIPLGSLSLQYTKIEPFTYTHPDLEVPWIDTTIDTTDRVYESFVSGSEGLCSKLDPNSDELLLRFTAAPLPAVTIHAAYQRIRHGAYGGSYQEPLMNYSGDLLSDSMDSIYEEVWGVPTPTDLSQLRKAFLRDGPYTWYHVYAVGGGVDLLPYVGLPVEIDVTGSLVWQYRKDHTGEPLAWDQEGLHPYITVSLKIWE